MSSLSRRSLLGGLLGLVAAPAATAAAAPFWQFADGNIRWQLRDEPQDTPRPLISPAVLVWSGPSYAAAHAFLQAYRLRVLHMPVGYDAGEGDAESRAEAECTPQEPAHAWLDGATT